MTYIIRCIYNTLQTYSTESRTFQQIKLPIKRHILNIQHANTYTKKTEEARIPTHNHQNPQKSKHYAHLIEAITAIFINSSVFTLCVQNEKNTFFCHNSSEIYAIKYYRTKIEPQKTAK